MEEQIGKLWDRLITRAAGGGFSRARVTLAEVEKTAGILFRALGGDGGLKLVASQSAAHGARRAWLKRLAGTDARVAPAGRDGETLRLPPAIDVFPDKALNRDLYLWLAALAAAGADDAAPWVVTNQARTRATLARYPGLAARYRRLARAYLALRPDPNRLPPDEARVESAIRRALREPGSVDALPAARRPPWPVALWLYPLDPLRLGDPAPDVAPEAGGRLRDPAERRRLRAERVPTPRQDRGILIYRFEALLSWAEYVKLDRATEEGDDADAEQAARDMDVLSVTRDSEKVAARVRFDLDLPPESGDDTPLGDGVLLPEWDYRRQRLLPDHVRIEPLIAAGAEPVELPAPLHATARRLRHQFEALVQGRQWLRGQDQGNVVDLDAYLRKQAERRHHGDISMDGLYLDQRKRSRDLACLLLADLSLSTDAWVNDERRVIDVVRDALFLFSEALSATGDRFALYGFSSRRREHVRFHTLKEFGEDYGARVRGRIQAIRPGFYTRMGAAIRQATTLLGRETAAQRLLLLLTDGKPNDLDLYEGRYGIEDTRRALHEARRAGLQPFCVTVDREAGSYLPHLFGADSYTLLREPSELPRRLPLLYARLTR